MRPVEFIKYLNVARMVQKVGHPCSNLLQSTTINLNDSYYAYSYCIYCGIT